MGSGAARVAGAPAGWGREVKPSLAAWPGASTAVRRGGVAVDNDFDALIVDFWPSYGWTHLVLWLYDKAALLTAHWEYA